MDHHDNQSRYSPSFKAKVVLEALTASQTDTTIASAFGIHPVTLSRWKSEFLRRASSVFESIDRAHTLEAQRDEFREQLESRDEELLFLRAILEESIDIDKKVELVTKHRERFGLNRICEVLGLPKSTYYYRINQAD